MAISSKFQQSILDLQHLKESLFKKWEDSDELQKAEGQLKHGSNPLANISPVVRPIGNTNWFLEPQEKNGDATYKAYPARAGNIVTPFRASAGFFDRIGEAINKAKKSVDIVTMGLDTDFDLRRDPILNKNRTIEYIRAYPATPAKPRANSPDGNEGNKKTQYCNHGDSEPEKSYVLSDLLTRKAREGVKVRLLVSAPHPISECFRDPLHLWYRSKVMPGYENLRFALRKFNGENVRPPATPPIDMSEFSLSEWAKAKASMGVDALAQILMALHPAFYKFVYAHHQKLVVIDMEDEAAQAFVIGSNFNEEYWDDNEHKSWNERRAPYAPWRDAGLLLKGPVINDIARNIEESWSVLSEDMPDYLIAEGRKAEAAGMLREKFSLDRQGSPLGRGYDFYRFFKIFEKVPLVLAALQLAKGDNALNALAMCASLTLFMDMISGLAGGSLDMRNKGIKPANPWDGKYLAPDRYNNAYDQNESDAPLPAQFLRTFCQEGAEVEFSIVRDVYRALTKVGQKGLIYIENQYVRDLHMIQLLKYIAGSFPKNLIWNDTKRGKGIRPYLIIVTSDFALSTEGFLANEPSFIAYKELEKTGMPFHFCRLRTKEYIPKKDNKIADYEGPREMVGRGDMLFDCLWEIFKVLLTLSPLLLLQVGGKFRQMRDALWTAVPMMLLGRKAPPNITALLADIDRFIRYLLRLDLNPQPAQMKDPKTGGGSPPLVPEPWPEDIKPLLGDVEPLNPEQADPWAHDIDRTLIENLPKTPAGIPVPPYRMIKGKQDDPGKIYVHSKVLIVDQAFAMVGSANHNERSMWHDSEDMLGVRGFQTTHFPAILRDELIANILAEPPKEKTGERIFAQFTTEMRENALAFFRKQNQNSLVLQKCSPKFGQV